MPRGHVPELTYGTAIHCFVRAEREAGERALGSNKLKVLGHEQRKTMSDETMYFRYRTHETFQHLRIESSAYVLQAGPVPRTAKVSFPDRGPQDDARSRVWNTFARNLEERRASSLRASLAACDFLLRRPDVCVGRKVVTCYPKSSVVLSEGDEVVRITQRMRGLT